MQHFIDAIEQQQMKHNIPEFRPGDTVVVNVKVKEGNRERLQAFEGVVIARRNRGMNSAFTVRKISYGEGVERVFQLHSPTIESIQVKRRGEVRKAKLYHLRELSGKAARIREKVLTREELDAIAKAHAEREAAIVAEAEKASAEEAQAAQETQEQPVETQKAAEPPKAQEAAPKAEEKPAEEKKPEAKADDAQSNAEDKPADHAPKSDDQEKPAEGEEGDEQK